MVLMQLKGQRDLVPALFQRYLDDIDFHRKRSREEVRKNAGLVGYLFGGWDNEEAQRRSDVRTGLEISALSARRSNFL